MFTKGAFNWSYLQFLCVCVCVCVRVHFFNYLKLIFFWTLYIYFLIVTFDRWECGVERMCVGSDADGCSTCSSCGTTGRHHCSCCASARLSRQRRGRAHWSGGVWGETTAGVVRRINLQMRARERERSVCEEARSTFKTCNLSFPSPALRPRLASLSLCSAKIGSSILLILQAEQQ